MKPPGTNPRGSYPNHTHSITHNTAAPRTARLNTMLEHYIGPKLELIEYHKPLTTPNDTQRHEDNDMPTHTLYTLARDEGPDVRFQGERIAHVSSRRPDNDDRWTELSLYRSTGGKLIAHQVGRTIWQGEHDRHAVFVCEGVSELTRYLGYGWLAKSLYEAAGVDSAEEID